MKLKLPAAIFSGLEWSEKIAMQYTDEPKLLFLIQEMGNEVVSGRIVDALMTAAANGLTRDDVVEGLWKGFGLDVRAGNAIADFFGRDDLDTTELETRLAEIEKEKA